MTAEISVGLIKELRDRTGIGMGACKKALMDAEGDLDKAITLLRKSGMASAVKKEGRETNEGMIGIAETESAVAIAEVKAETDFVVKNARFQEFVKEIAEEAAQTAPASLEEFLKQNFSKEGGIILDEYRATIVQTIGENIQISRVAVIPKGEGKSVGRYSHHGGKIGVVVTLSGGEGEEQLAKEIAMHAAAAAPEFLSPEQVPADLLEQEREIAREQVAGKPENIIDKIVEGKIGNFYKERCLARQSFIRDEKKTVADVVAERAKESGKPLALDSFIRWTIGE